MFSVTVAENIVYVRDAAIIYPIVSIQMLIPTFVVHVYVVILTTSVANVWIV